jgi:hypothetical protein
MDHIKQHGRNIGAVERAESGQEKALRNARNLLRVIVKDCEECTAPLDDVWWFNCGTTIYEEAKDILSQIDVLEAQR